MRSGNLSIQQKLGFLVTLVAFALILVGAFSLLQASRQHQKLEDSIEQHKLILSTVDATRAAQVHFKIQVQEWKNVLLRGKDQEAFDKHLKGFDHEAGQVRQYFDEVEANATTLKIAERIKLKDVRETYEKLLPAYADALKKFDRTQTDPAALVDKAVKGIDRPPTKAIDDLVTDMLTIAVELNTAEIKAGEEIYSSIRLWTILLSPVPLALHCWSPSSPSARLPGH